MGLTLARQRSTIIDFTVNEECGVYRLRAKEEQWGQPELVEKVPETALSCSNSKTPSGRRQANSKSFWKSAKVKNVQVLILELVPCQQWRKFA